MNTFKWAGVIGLGLLLGACTTTPKAEPNATTEPSSESMMAEPSSAPTVDPTMLKEESAPGDQTEDSMMAEPTETPEAMMDKPGNL